MVNQYVFHRALDLTQFYQILANFGGLRLTGLRVRRVRREFGMVFALLITSGR
jgi:hypothetical protein